MTLSDKQPKEEQALYAFLLDNDMYPKTKIADIRGIAPDGPAWGPEHD